MQDLVTRLAFKEHVAEEEKKISLDRYCSSQHIKITESMVWINSGAHTDILVFFLPE